MIVPTSNRAPQLRRELTDVDNCGQVADKDDHGRIRALVTTVTMSELMKRLTPAATITGIALVPIP